jgi:RNA polymerase-binding transcription factor DksA
MHTISDENLRAVREGLLARSAELRDRIRRVQDDFRREKVPLPRDAPDAALVLENDEVLQAVDETARTELQKIERALERMEAGTYGVCEQCGLRIDGDRLRAVPYTTYCRPCAADD